MDPIYENVIDDLYWLTGEKDVDSIFFDSREMVVDLMELLINPEISEQIPGSLKKDIGPFLHRLHTFFLSLDASQDLKEVIKQYAKENY